jgi:ferredoxin-NADP reductase
MYLSKLKPGQEVRIKGPKGKFVYTWVDFVYAVKEAQH